MFHFEASQKYWFIKVQEEIKKHIHIIIVYLKNYVDMGDDENILPMFPTTWSKLKIFEKRNNFANIMVSKNFIFNAVFKRSHLKYMTNFVRD